MLNPASKRPNSAATSDIIDHIVKVCGTVATVVEAVLHRLSINSVDKL